MCTYTGLFLASGSSVPVGIMHGVGTVAWITGPLATPANTGGPAAIVAGDMVLLRLFLGCGSSAPVRTEHEGDAAAWGGGGGRGSTVGRD